MLLPRGRVRAPRRPPAGAENGLYVAYPLVHSYGIVVQTGMKDKDASPSVSPHAPLRDFYADDAERRQFLTRIFDETAPSYDGIAGLMSFGSGAWYRRNALRRAGLREGMHVLDVAVGTGEVARGAMSIVGPSGRVLGVDPSIGMLRQARRKLGTPIVQGVAEQIPFRDTTFDFLSMGYALRHVADLRQPLAEYFRVLKPGGTLLILDFACPRSRIGETLGKFYLGGLVPWLSRMRFGSQAHVLTRYCWETVEELVSPEVVVDSMKACGFEQVAGARFALLSEYVGRRP